MDDPKILDRINIVECRLNDHECRLNEHCYRNDIKFDEIYCKIRNLECMNEALIDCIQKIEAAMPHVIEILQEESMPIDRSALEQIL